jgi:hypothetical protein
MNALKQHSPALLLAPLALLTLAPLQLLPLFLLLTVPALFPARLIAPLLPPLRLLLRNVMSVLITFVAPCLPARVLTRTTPVPPIRSGLAALILKMLHGGACGARNRDMRTMPYAHRGLLPLDSTLRIHAIARLNGVVLAARQGGCGSGCLFRCGLRRCGARHPGLLLLRCKWRRDARGSAARRFRAWTRCACRATGGSTCRLCVIAPCRASYISVHMFLNVDGGACCFCLARPMSREAIVAPVSADIVRCSRPAPCVLRSDAGWTCLSARDGHRGRLRQRNQQRLKRAARQPMRRSTAPG